jgi:hypothetical protein
MKTCPGDSLPAGCAKPHEQFSVISNAKRAHQVYGATINGAHLQHICTNQSNKATCQVQKSLCPQKILKEKLGKYISATLFLFNEIFQSFQALIGV